MFRSNNRIFVNYKSTSNDPDFKSKEIDWMSMLSNADDYANLFIPLLREYDRMLVEKVTLVLKNIKVQVFHVESKPRDKVLSFNKDGDKLVAMYDNEIIGNTSVRDITRKKEEIFYYWSGNHLNSEAGVKIKDDKDRWNLFRKVCNSNSVIKRTFLSKGKSVSTHSYRTDCINQAGPFVKDLLKNTAVDGKTKYPHLMVLPDLLGRMYGDMLMEEVQYQLIADLHLYVHIRLCSRNVDRR